MPGKQDAQGTFVAACVARALKEAGFEGRELIETQADLRYPLKVGAINNYVRSLGSLHPLIVKEWAKGDPRAKMTYLIKLARMSRSEQLRAWRGRD
jgi:hypothetical protein